jgi:hypothetical protein
MRMMMKVSIGTEAGNRAAKDGRIGKILSATGEKLRPESAYFTSINGKRTAMFFFDMTDSSTMPTIAEQLFQELDAEVELTPVMNVEDLKKGLAAAGIK